MRTDLHSIPKKRKRSREELYHNTWLREKEKKKTEYLCSCKRSKLQRKIWDKGRRTRAFWAYHWRMSFPNGGFETGTRVGSFWTMRAKKVQSSREKAENNGEGNPKETEVRGRKWLWLYWTGPMASSPSGSSSSSSASAVFLHFEFLQNSAFEVRGRERQGDQPDSLTVAVLFTMPRSLPSHAPFSSDPSILAVHPRIKVAIYFQLYVYSDDFPFSL